MPGIDHQSQLEKRLLLKERELKALLEITQAITQNLPDIGLYKIYQFTLLGQLGVRRLALLVLEEGVFQVKVNFGTPLDQATRLLPAEVEHWCANGPCKVCDMELGPTWAPFEMLVPLRLQGSTQAVVLVGAVQGDHVSADESLSFLATLSNILLGAVVNRRLARLREASMMAEAAVQREIEIAQQVQQRLFPQHLPNTAELAVAASYLPHTEIGGDYYDVVQKPDGCWLLCVADVSGKGMAASLLMSNFQAGLRTLLRTDADLRTIVQELNNLIFRNAGGEKFITAFVAIYNPQDRVLEYVNAGHNDPLLLPDTGPPELLHEGTVMLGIMDELPPFRLGLTRMEPHSLLFAYTDGLTEVFNQQNDEFGEAGVLEVLHGHRYLPLPRLHQQLLGTISRYNAHGAHFADDITLLSMRVK